MKALILACALCMLFTSPSAVVAESEVGWRTKPAVEMRLKQKAARDALKKAPEKYPDKKPLMSVAPPAKPGPTATDVKDIEKSLCEVGKACLAEITFSAPIIPPTGMMFLAAMEHYNNIAGVDAILVTLNSPGGRIGVAQIMYQAIKDSEKPVHCVVNGTAASAAFWLLQACDRRVAVATAHLMTHEARIHQLRGDLTVRVLQDRIDDLEHINSVMADTIAPRMRISTAKLKRKWAQGNWSMTAKQSLKNHAIDLLVPSIKEYRKRLDRHFTRRR